MGEVGGWREVMGQREGSDLIPLGSCGPDARDQATPQEEGIIGTNEIRASCWGRGRVSFSCEALPVVGVTYDPGTFKVLHDCLHMYHNQAQGRATASISWPNQLCLTPDPCRDYRRSTPGSLAPRQGLLGLWVWGRILRGWGGSSKLEPGGSVSLPSCHRTQC